MYLSSMDQYFCDTNYLMFENKWIITIINYLHARVSYNFLEDIAWVNFFWTYVIILRRIIVELHVTISLFNLTCSS